MMHYCEILVKNIYTRAGVNMSLHKLTIFNMLESLCNTLKNSLVEKYVKNVVK